MCPCLAGAQGTAPLPAASANSALMRGSREPPRCLHNPRVSARARMRAGCTGRPRWRRRSPRHTWRCWGGRRAPTRMRPRPRSQPCCPTWPSRRGARVRQGPAGGARPQRQRSCWACCSASAAAGQARRVRAARPSRAPARATARPCGPRWRRSASLQARPHSCRRARIIAPRHLCRPNLVVLVGGSRARCCPGRGATPAGWRVAPRRDRPWPRHTQLPLPERRAR